MKRINKKQSGFTLLELLVVVAILAIIAGAVISAISGQEERAGQGVALNTMGALENATRQNVVLNGGLPSGLDSLLCADTSLANANLISASGALMGSATTPTAHLGGLTDDYAGILSIVNLPVGVAADGTDPAANLISAGLSTFRYVETNACNSGDNDVVDVGGIALPAGVEDEGLDEVLANTLFWPLDQGGFGVEAALVEEVALSIVVLNDPTRVGADQRDIVGIFGIGNFSELSEGRNKIISRGPVDGNVDGDGQYYSHFSLAVKVGEVDDGELGSNQAAITTSSEFEADEIEIVAILDSDGDNFDDEIAEFNGLEDE